MARPRIEIDKDIFEKLCALLCTEEEIASFFNVSIDTLNRWCKRVYSKSFAEVYIYKSAGGKIALRRYQMRLAEKHPAMAIFLGKQYLGQDDDKEKDDGAIKVIIERKVQDLTSGENDDE